MTDYKIKIFNKSWRLFQLRVTGIRPHGLKEWLCFLWGFDIWIGKAPFLKIMALANVLVWLIF